MSALSGAGIDRALVEALGLGMKEPYLRTDGSITTGVITYPLGEKNGRRRYGYINLPGMTSSPAHPVAWSPGPPEFVHYGTGGVLLVVGSPVTLFQIRRSVESRMLNVAIVASSQPDRMPAAWHDAFFWDRWDRVILCDDLPAAIAKQLATLSRRPVEQASGIVLHRFPDRPISDGIDEWVDEIVDQAQPYLSRAIGSLKDHDERPGDFAADPIHLHGGFAQGHLYYPFLVERRQHATIGDGRLLHSYETLVLRSDGRILEAVTLPAPPGAPPSQRVHALTDGTRISSPPKQSRNATWSLASIHAFAAARSEGRSPCVTSPAAILATVREYLATRVILPSADDHWLAAVFILVTHMFRVFDALPIILIQGPPGTGKTELATDMASLGFNAAVMGQGSARALVRLSRECGGLVVLDDAESLGGSGFSELGQCLKVGYRAATARKPITQANGQVEVFDFFGPRVVTCTRDIDPVLASRCITIKTSLAEVATSPLDVDSDSIRDSLHTIAMMAAPDVRDAYAAEMNCARDRTDEIWAPLYAVARAFDCRDAINALSRRKKQ